MVIFIYRLDCNEKKIIFPFLIGRYRGFSGVGLEFENFEKSVFQSQLLKLRFLSKTFFTNELDIHEIQLFDFMKFFVRPTLGWLAAILYFLAEKSKMAAATASKGQVTPKYHQNLWGTFVQKYHHYYTLSPKQKIEKNAFC